MKNTPKAKLVARGVDKTCQYLASMPKRSQDNTLTIVSPFKTEKGAHIYCPITPEQALEMLELWTPFDLSMNDRIVVYRLQPYTYHLTFEGLEAIPT